jgi:molybdopterin-guanine dinucleotide biosynthesis protein A
MIEEATLAILAGGASRRMGRPKHLLPTRRGTVVEHLVETLSPFFREILLVGKGDLETPGGVRWVEDARPERSALVGIHTALCAMDTSAAVVIACDMPFVLPDVARALLVRAPGFDVVVPKVGGFYEPLLAVYRRSCLAAIDEALDAGVFRIASIFPDLRVREVSEEALREVDPDLVSLTNLNTPRELALLARL